MATNSSGCGRSRCKGEYSTDASTTRLDDSCEGEYSPYGKSRCKGEYSTDALGCHRSRCKGEYSTDASTTRQWRPIRWDVTDHSAKVNIWPMTWRWDYIWQIATQRWIFDRCVDDETVANIRPSLTVFQIFEKVILKRLTNMELLRS